MHVGVSAHRLCSWEGSPCQGEVGKYMKPAEKGKKRYVLPPVGQAFQEPNTGDILFKRQILQLM